MIDWNNRRVGAESHPLNAETIEREAGYLERDGQRYVATLLRKAWAEIERLNYTGTVARPVGVLWREGPRRADKATLAKWLGESS